MDNATRKLQQAGRNLRLRGRRWHGLLGGYTVTDSCAVADRGGYWWVRIRQAGSSTYALGQFRGSVPDLYNLPVVIERDPLSGDQYITGIDRIMIEYGISEDPDNYAPPPAVIPGHNDSHEFGGSGQLDWLDTRQLYALRIQPTGNVAEVLLQGGIYYVDAAYYLRPEMATVNLAAYVPASGETWVLICLDTTGDINISDVDAIYNSTGSNAYRLSAAQTGKAAVALVRIKTGLAPDWPDILDLRFATQATSGGSLRFFGAVDEIIDQSNTAMDWRIITGTDLYQSFTPAQAGQTLRAAFYVHEIISIGAGSSYPWATLHQGNDGAGTVLGTATARLTAYNGAGRWLEFQFNPPMVMTPGTVYTLVLHGCNRIGYTTDDAYPAGAAGKEKATPLITGYDLMFKIWTVVSDNPYIAAGHAGLYVHAGNISLAPGLLVDGMDVSTLPDRVSRIEAMFDLVMSNHVLRGV